MRTSRAGDGKLLKRRVRIYKTMSLCEHGGVVL